MLEYTESFDALLMVAGALLGHAGDIEVFKDENGLLCIRTQLTRSTGPNIKGGCSIHEPYGDKDDGTWGPEHENHVEGWEPPREKGQFEV